MTGKYSSIFITAAVAVTVAVGCGGNSSDSYKPPTFKDVGEVKFSLVAYEPLWNWASKIIRVDDLLVVSEYQRDSVETFLHVFDTAGSKIADYLNMGRGPNEITFPPFSLYSEGSSIFFYDYGQNLDYELILEDHGKRALLNSRYVQVEDPISLSQNFRINDNYLRYHTVSPQEDPAEIPRLTLEDADGNILSAIYTSPFDGEDPMVKFRLGAQGYSLALSPDKKRFVMTYNGAGVIEIFSVSDDSIKEDYLRRYFQPKFTVKGYDVLPKDDAVRGFGGPCATDSYILIPFDGSKYGEKKELIYSDIAVFDWKGRPVKLLKTDYSVGPITYSESEGVIYSVIRDKFRNAYIGKLKIDL